MNDLKHVHAVEAGEQSLVALVIRYGVEHLVIHHSVIISMQHFPYQKEILLLTVTEAPQPSCKVFVQAICHIKTQSVDIKFLDPALDRTKNMLYHLFVSEI